MSRKSWVILTLICLLLCIGGAVAAVTIVDPFELYHKATLYRPPIDNGTQSYSNAGIAKSYEYDSVIIGSSMTENFSPSQLDEVFGGTFVKLCINGGSPFNHGQMMTMAFATHDVKRVFYGIDIELLTYFHTTPKTKMPDFLYDFNLFNDTQYWFNKTVLAKYIPECLAAWGQDQSDQRDTMYTWGDLYPYGKDAVMRGKTISPAQVRQRDRSDPPEFSRQYYLNFETNYRPYIEAHPDTEFIFFFPPYSVMRWYEFYAEGTMGYYLDQRVALTEALLPYDNVRIYDFTAEVDWITDLDNYIDTSHYGPWINDAIVVAVGEDRCRVTSTQDIADNNAVLFDYVNRLRVHGEWPDSFDDVQ